MAHMRKHPKSGRWQVRYRDPSGRERSRNFKRKIDADRFLVTVSADVLRGDYIDARLGRATVAEMAERWCRTRSHLARATRDQDSAFLRSLVLPHFGTRAVGSVRRSEVAAWLAGLDVAPATKAKALQKLSAIFGVAVGDGALRSNPCDRIPRPTQRPNRVGRALTDDEIEAVLDAAEAVDESSAAMVHVMARAGLRIGEAIALKRVDVDGGMLHIRQSMSRREGLRAVKGRSGGRSITMPDGLQARLQRHMASQTLASLEGWLFVAARGGPIRYNNWRSRTWNRIVEKAGVGDLKPHDLRHTVATRLFVVDAWTVPQVQAYLGHVDPTVTLRVYTHVRPHELPTPSMIRPGR